MSELLIGWLNDEVQLSKRINNFEQDFHNGYLFGELLSKYSQQLNFNEFIDKDDKASRIRNFTLLYDTFKTLRVSFDSNIAMTIIEKKIGIAKKVLYELKMQLEKTTTNSFNKMIKASKPLSPLKKIPLPKQKFDKISKQHFNKQLNQIHSAQKAINLDSHLQKYPQFHYNQLQKIDIDDKKQAQARLLGQMKFRQKQLDNIKKSSQFRNDWEQSNLEKWANNMAVRRLQDDKDNMFQTKIFNNKMQTRTLSELNAVKSLGRDLKDFQKNTLKKQGDSSSSDNQTQQKSQKQITRGYLSKTITKGVNPIGNPSSGNSIAYPGEFAQIIGVQSKLKSNINNQYQQQERKKKNPLQVQQSRHQRQKRRRKMIVQQSKKHQIIKIERRQKYIMSTIEQTSKQQKQIQYQIWRAWQNKQIIIQNKNIYNQKIKDKQNTRNINAKFKDDELIKSLRQEHEKQLKDGIERQKKLQIQNTVKDRKNVYDQCKQIIECFIDMTQIVYCYGQQKNKQNIDDNFLNHLFDEFVQSTTSKKQIGELELKNYIHGKGQWNIKIKKDSQEQSEDPTLDNSLPTTVINNYYLGNILKTVFKDIYKEQTSNYQQSIDYENLVSLIGLDYAGKSTISTHIQNNLGFYIISIPELVQEKLLELQDMKAKGFDIKGETKQIMEYVIAGKNIPNSLIINLIKEKVKTNKNCLLLNYPNTYQESIQLCKVFGGVEPSSNNMKSKLAKKIQDFSRLLWPTETKIIPRSLKPCGIDFTLWIDISPRTSLDRFIGRRWTPQGEVLHINGQIVDPNVLLVGEKGSAIILKNNFKLKNKKKIENWFNQFGIVVQQNDNDVIQSCWQTISGECSIQELLQQVTNLLNNNISLKNKKKLQKKDIENKKQKQIENIKEKQKFEDQLKQKCSLSTYPQIQERLKKAIDEVKMDNSFLEGVQRLWNNTEKLTVNGFVNIFQVLRDQEQAKNRHISNTKRNFIRMLTREDQRFYLVKKFQNDYNRFLDENNDMIIQQHTKEQLHQRIDDLELDLLTLIEEKKEDAVTQRENTMKSGWLQSQLQQIISCVHTLLQIQLNRSFTCQQIIGDFYSKKYLVNTGEVQEFPIDLGMDSELEIIKDNNSPRLDKLIADCLRIFNKEEEVLEDKNKKGGKAPPAKKDDKKQAKKGGKQQIEEKVEATAQDKEFKSAINTQKAILRYRVKILGGFALKKLKQFQQAGQKLYTDLEDLYKYTDKIENKAVVQMTKIFKRIIQKQNKIQNEVQILYTEVIQSELIRNYKKPSAIILPAIEKVKPERFTISAIREIFKIFKNQSQAGINIKNNRLLTLLQQLSINQRYSSILPQIWKTLTKAQHQKFIAKFDTNCKGQIQLWVIFTVIALSDCHLPLEKQIKEYELHVTDHNPLIKQIDLHRIENTVSWFDSIQPIEENIRFFDRNKQLKRVLFDTYKKQDGSDKVIVDRFLKRVTFLEDRDLHNPNPITYFEFAFGSP